MTSKIRILVDAHVFDGMFQGSRTFLKGLYTKLSESDLLEIYFAAHDIDNLERELRCIPGSVNVIKLKSSGRAQRMIFEIPSIISEYKIDYAHFQYIDSPLKRCKTIITIHDVLFLEFIEDFSWLYRQKKFFFKLAASRANILTTDSKYSRYSISNHLNIPAQNIHIVQPGLDDMFFEELPEFSTIASREAVLSGLGFDKYILYVSRIEPRKNHDLLVRAYINLELWKRGYHLVFVGKLSIDNPKLHSLYATLSKEALSFVHHYETVSHKLLMDLFRAATLFVYPTRAEGFGYPVLEAGALGVETLTSNSTCLSEFDFFRERFFSPDDLAELEDKIFAILMGNFAGPAMSDISKTIRHNFDWTTSAEVMENLISNGNNTCK